MGLDTKIDKHTCSGRWFTFSFLPNMASWELHIEHLLIHLDYLTTKCVDHVENEWLAWVGRSSCVLLPEKKVKLWWGRRSCLSVESRSKTRSRPLGTEVNSASTWGRPQNSLDPDQFTAKKIVLSSTWSNMKSHPCISQTASLSLPNPWNTARPTLLRYSTELNGHWS